MIRPTVLLVIYCACCCAAWAQEAATHGMPPSLAILAPTVGVSTQQLANKKTAFAPKRMVGQRQVTRRWILNRKFIEESATTIFKDYPEGESHAIYTFDEHEGKFRWWVFDTFGVSSEYVGTWDAKNRTIAWKQAQKRSDGYNHVTKEVVHEDGTLEWESKGTQANGTLAVHQTGKTNSPPRPVRQRNRVRTVISDRPPHTT